MDGREIRAQLHLLGQSFSNRPQLYSQVCRKLKSYSAYAISPKHETKMNAVHDDNLFL